MFQYLLGQCQNFNSATLGTAGLLAPQPVSFLGGLQTLSSYHSSSHSCFHVVFHDMKSLETLYQLSSFAHGNQYKDPESKYTVFLGNLLQTTLSSVGFNQDMGPIQVKKSRLKKERRLTVLLCFGVRSH